MPIHERATIWVLGGAVVLATMLGACAGGDDDRAPAVMTIADAVASPDGTEAVVEGFLFEEGGVVVLAETIAESFPPQPGGATVTVEGLDLAPLDLQDEGPVRWSDQRVAVRGTVREGRLIEAALG